MMVINILCHREIPNTNKCQHNNNVNCRLLKQIHNIVYVSGPSCKSRWSNIRDDYRKSLKKGKTVSGQKAKAVKSYKYAQQLSFLTKFFEDRETLTDIDDDFTNQDWTGNDEVNEENTDITTAVNNPVTDESQSHTAPSSIQNVSKNFATGSRSLKSSTLRKRKQLRQIAGPTKTAAATVMEYFVKRNESMVSALLSPQHLVYAFLKGMVPALKKLTPRHWHYAKGKIFAAVQKYELQMLIDQ